MLAVVTQRLESSVLRVVTEVEGRLVAALRTGRLLDLDGVHSRSPLRPSGCHRPAFQLRHAGLPGDLWTPPWSCPSAALRPRRGRRSSPGPPNWPPTSQRPTGWSLKRTPPPPRRRPQSANARRPPGLSAGIPPPTGRRAVS